MISCLEELVNGKSSGFCMLQPRVDSAVDELSQTSKEYTTVLATRDLIYKPVIVFQMDKPCSNENGRLRGVVAKYSTLRSAALLSFRETE